MRIRLRQNLTYANVAATIGLFAGLGGLGGGAYALATKAPPESVNSKAIVDNSIKSQDVKDGSLTGADIDQSTLSGGGGSGGPPSGPAGGDLAGNYPKPQIASGAVGPGALANNAVGTNALADAAVSASKLGNGVVGASQLGKIVQVVNNGGAGSFATATCPPGSVLISGGGDDYATPLLISEPDPENARAWYVDVGSDNPGEVEAKALCLK